MTYIVSYEIQFSEYWPRLCFPLNIQNRFDSIVGVCVLSLCRVTEFQRLGWPAVLPDGVFSDQKSEFLILFIGLWQMLVYFVSIAMEHFREIWYILGPFSNFAIIWYISPVWVFYTRRNLAALLTGTFEWVNDTRCSALALSSARRRPA